MKKKLNEMTLEELWQLFPIFLVPHNNLWKSWYEDESKLILSLFQNDEIKSINHIGSTSIPNIWSKNIIDILVTVNSVDQFKKIEEILTSNEWILMSKQDDRISFNKGYS